MKIVVTGSDGFIGKNLCYFLEERNFEVLKINRKTESVQIESFISEADFVYHLAGINRPKKESDLIIGNIDFTKSIIDLLVRYEKKIPIVFSSSTQATNNLEYGRSKLRAEELIQNYSNTIGAPSFIYRLPNVFGKWCRPNYNSFVATFCNNISKNMNISINDETAKVKLVYIDDLCKSFIDLLDSHQKSRFVEVTPQYNTTVGEVADIIKSFHSKKDLLITDRVGHGLKRALYSTYLSYSTPENFSYNIISHEDDRGVFCEMLKTTDSGQFSFFTAHPGITRGGHYHHTKNEKFLVVKGNAKFKFENISSGERHIIETHGSNPEVVETIPGWSHDITNIGKEELVVLLWANEIFNVDEPDTFARELF
jgi:UDP-2-acetamido-2,6-beta-L-arabino-hexul-4-ose reductase